MGKRGVFAASLFVAVVSVLGASQLAAGAGAEVRVIATGLNNPRGVAVAPDGSVFVAQAGAAGTKCQGTGRHKRTDTIKVKIPPGVDTGSTLKVSGKGEAGPLGGESGDLYVHLTAEKSKDYIRDGYDIYTEKEISVPQAVLGAEIPIATLYGELKLKIPAGTPAGKVFRLKEYGVQKLQRSDRGDHMVTIVIKIPTKLSRKEKELYEQLGQSE